MTKFEQRLKLRRATIVAGCAQGDGAPLLSAEVCGAALAKRRQFRAKPKRLPVKIVTPSSDFTRCSARCGSLLLLTEVLEERS